jgi:hypothetical protein
MARSKNWWRKPIRPLVVREGVISVSTFERMRMEAAQSALLTTDETFDESAIGSHISEGMKYLIEWRKKQKIAEVETITISDDDDDDNYAVDATGKSTASTSDDVSTGLAFLLTHESFPAKLLKEEEDMSADDSASVNNNNKISYNESSRRNKRKSVVFQSNNSNNTNKQWWKKEETIQDLIPSNDSGIVGVMGRKIDMEQMSENNSSVYSMLRAWVENDPSNTDRRNKPPPPPVDSSSSSSSRKTISEYATMKPVTKSSSGSATRIEWSRTNNKNSGRVKTSSLSSSVPPFDLIKWLDTDPNLRMTIPYYPDEKQTRELAEQHKAKQAAKAARALAKKRLKSKGIL